MLKPSLPVLVLSLAGCCASAPPIQDDVRIQVGEGVSVAAPWSEGDNVFEVMGRAIQDGIVEGPVSEVIILREGEGDPLELNVDFDAIREGNTVTNQLILAGDLILVGH